MSKPSNDNLYSLWDIQDGLLQSYRSIFITSEAIIVGISAASISTSKWWHTAILTFIGLSILKVWKKVTETRTMDVSFAQWLIYENETNCESSINNPLSCLKEWQQGRDKYKINTKQVIKDDIFKSFNDCKGARTYLENSLPKIIYFCLFLILFFSISQNFNFFFSFAISFSLYTILFILVDIIGSEPNC